MKPANPHATAISWGFASFLVAAAIGWNLAGGFAEPSREKELPAVTRSSRPRPAARPSRIDAETERKLAIIRNEPDPVERLRATLEFANSLPLSEIETWLQGGRFSVRDGAEPLLFTTLLRDRWFREDPEGLARWAMKDRSRGAADVFFLLATTQPQRALAFFKVHPDPVYGFQAMAVMAREHPELALQGLMDLNAAGISNISLRNDGEVFDILAEKSPSALEAQLGFMKGPLKDLADLALVKARMKNDLRGELHKLRERPDGLEVFSSASSDMEGRNALIFEELESLPPSWHASVATFVDPSNAENWWNLDFAEMGFSAADEQKVRLKALQEMAVHHPQAALERMARLELPPQEGDSDGSERKWGIIRAALSGNPGRSEEIIAALTSGKEREIAEYVLKEQAAAQDGPSYRPVTPERWLEKAVGAGSGDREALLRMSQAGFVELGERFQTLSDDQKQKVAPLLTHGVSILDMDPPITGEAIRYLLANPPAGTTGSGLIQHSAKYASSLAAKDSEAGRDWVQSLPDGEAKLWAQLNLYSTWKNYDREDAERWLKSQPADTQTQVRDLETKSRK